MGKNLGNVFSHEKLRFGAKKSINHESNEIFA